MGCAAMPAGDRKMMLCHVLYSRSLEKFKLSKEEFDLLKEAEKEEEKKKDEKSEESKKGKKSDTLKKIRKKIKTK